MPDADRPRGPVRAAARAASAGRSPSALGRPFVDLDAAHQRRARAAPRRRIIEARRRGARSGRSRRPRCARRSPSPGAVIATGGGAVIDPLSRWALWDAGLVGVARRARRAAARRGCAAPTSDGRSWPATPSAALARLRAAREPFYAAADVRIEPRAAPGRWPRPSIAGRVRDQRPRARRPVRRARPPRPPDGPARGAHGLRPRPGRADARSRSSRHAPRACPWSSPTRRVVRGAARPHGRVPGRAPAAHRPAGERAKRHALGGATAGGGRGAARASAATPGSPSVAARPGTSWAPPRRCTSGARRWSRCPPRGWPVRLRASAARSPSTSPRPRTRRVRSGRPWRSSGTSAALRTLPRELLLDGLARGAQVGRHRRPVAVGAAGDPRRGRAGRRWPHADEAARYAMVERADAPQAGRRRPGPIRGRASDGSSTWATPWATRWRSRATTGCRTARRSCSACAPWSPSRRAAAPSTASPRASTTSSRRLGYRLTRVVRSRPRSGTRSGRTRSASGAASAGSCPWPSARVMDVDDVTDAELDLALDAHHAHSRGVTAA